LRGFAVVPVCATFGVVLANPAPTIRADGAVLGRTNPCGAVQFLRDKRVVANVYTPLWWGAYVTWELYPAVHVSMDGRNISLFPPDMVRENLKFYVDPISGVDVDVPLHYDTDLILMPSDSPALSAVASDTRWRRIYADADAVLFGRTGRQQAAIASARYSEPSARLVGCSAALN
jgi:hypothetical protein